MTTATATDTTTKTYAIDLAHSEVLFQVRHLLAKVRGRFSDFSGTVGVWSWARTSSTLCFTNRGVDPS